MNKRTSPLLSSRWHVALFRKTIDLNIYEMNRVGGYGMEATKRVKLDLVRRKTDSH